LGADARRGLIAVGAGLNVYALYLLGGVAVIAVIIFVYTTIRGISPGEKPDPLSKAFKQGDLALRNARGEEINPYADADKQLSDAWITGYRKASTASRTQNAKS
jgi:ribosome modulation factor